MKRSVLSNKLTMPKLSPILHRADLVAQLQKAADYPLILLQGPPGFGKTCLVQDWISHSDHHVCWFTIDSMNNVPSDFWQYICSSLSSLSPNMTEQAQQRLDNSHIQDVTPICDELLSATHTFTRSRNRPNTCILVLDDFHHITNEKILSSVERFIDNKPHWLQVIITSRTLPPLRLPNRLSKRQAFLLTASDLSYTQQECKEILSTQNHLTLDDDRLNDFYLASQGWPAVVQLLSISKKPMDISKKPTSITSNEFIYDYLMEEIFLNLDSTTQSLLNIACVLPSFNLESLCYISDSTINPLSFDALLSCGLAINTNFSNKGIRIHEVFRAWLEYNLTQKSPNQVRSLRYKAIEWLSSNKNYEDAFKLAIKNEDWSKASIILSDIFDHSSKVGYLDYLHFLLNHFPDEEIERLPRLSILKAILLFNQHKRHELNHFLYCSNTLIKSIKNTEQNFDQTISNDNDKIITRQLNQYGIRDTSELDILSSSLTVLEDLIALFDGKATSIRSIQDAFTLPDHHPMYCWWHYLKFVHAFMQDELISAIDLGFYALKKARQQNDIMCCISTVSWLSHCLHQNGQTQYALTTTLEIQQWLTNIGALDTPNIFSLYASLGYLYLESLESEKAQAMYDLVESSITEFSEPREVIFNKYHFKFKLLMTTQQTESAAQCLEEMRAFENTHLHEKNSQLVYSAMPDSRILQILYELHLGNAMPIIQWAMEYEEQERIVPMKQDLERFIKAIGLTLCGQDQSETLDELITLATNSQNHTKRISLELFKCSVLDRQGHHDSANEHLIMLMENARSYGYKQSILDGGQIIVTLLESIPPFSVISDLRDELLNKVKNQTRIHTSSQQNTLKISNQDHVNLKAKIDLLNTLTTRESDVLKQLALGLRNKEIADELTISLATVKRHIQNIYGKLQINSRTEAALLFNHISV